MQIIAMRTGLGNNVRGTCTGATMREPYVIRHKAVDALMPYLIGIGCALRTLPVYMVMVIFRNIFEFTGLKDRE